jgi:hypothetical protein
MKNPEKQFLKASKIMRENSYRTLEGRRGSSILYYQAEKMSLEAQEEMGRQNKTKLLKEIKNSMAKRGPKIKYKKVYCQKVDEYLEMNQDEEVEVVKQRNNEKGYEIYNTKIKVKLPTIEGFARFIDVPKSTLYKWRGKYKELLDSLEKILTEQRERLINMGLSGEYNSTIAKLILSSNHGMVEKSETKHEGNIEVKTLLLPKEKGDE